MKKKVHVIHHTHWDFEWYFTNNESFVQLVYHLDEVINALETNQIDYYLLDGQMSILDEYLQSFPEQKPRLNKLVQSRRLQIGPWYTQTDELIVSGESIIRNLNLGIELADDLGGYMAVGYLPDSFGQSQDMPKIYNGFGIHRAVFWRGLSEEQLADREFNWVSQDGSTVRVSNIKNGYFVGVGLICEENYQELMTEIEAGATSEQLVLPVGGDQRYVDRNLRERIALYNQHLPEYELVESTYDDFFDALNEQKLQTISGEFIASSVSKIHRSIYSSRYDHKYMNDRLERRMIYQVEPLMVMAEKVGIPYKKGVLDRIWKLLTKNQAHDSAGGCNSDRTNQIISERYTEAEQLSASLVDYLTRKIAESRTEVQENEITVYNPLPWAMKQVITVEVSVKSPSVTILENSSEIQIEQCKTIKEYSGSIRRNLEEQDETKFYYIHTLLVEVNVPAFSFKTYQLIEQATETAVVPKVKDTSSQIENSYYQVKMKNGKIQLLVKEQQLWLEDIFQIEDSGDEGDTYDYSPPYEDFTTLHDFREAKVHVIRHHLEERLQLSGVWLVAQNLEERKQKCVTKEIAYTLCIILKKASRQVQCQLTIDNQAIDHRMRVHIQTPFANRYSYADTPFGVAKRAVVEPHLVDWRELGWKEEPTTIFPMLHYVNAHNTTGSLTVFTKGIKEYQFVGQEFRQIALTLFRSVGYLGRPDLLRRPGIASGNEFKYIPTPDSQLQQSLVFKFALQWDSEYQPAQIEKSYLDYAVSLPYYQIQELNRFTNPLKYFVSNPLPKPAVQTLGMALISQELVFRSLRKSTTLTGFDLRVFNPKNVQVPGGMLTFNQQVAYEWVNLKGIPTTSRKVGNQINLGIFAPGEIRTIHII
ncbi:glycoside hydrolase family 38 C-terminal domain-containing protein [Enterococcus sp. LX10]|uniref:glycoside hydrolase family 38 N-terminal domain-containing protein n=1 Tax=Enterococcus sp. LX10 TaxID=2920934 RepID=UPI00201F5390|nr:glycoside hydrolase family 38 C-terminal domain-containing protein [Enterococcus sp. LX10]